MTGIIQFLETTFQPLVLVFTVSNLFLMGLQVKRPEVIAALKNPKILALIILWGWVLGPAVGLLIAWALPLAEPFVIGLLLYSLAPCAPFLPVMVGKARGDMSFAGALVPLVAVGTVIFMPLMGPLLIKGLTISTRALAETLLLTILLPLVIGAAIREFARTAATRILPAVNVIAKITTVATPIWAAMIYWPEMLGTVGSTALLSMTIFMVVMGLITDRRFFGLKQNQRSVMSLGMLTRNGSVVLITVLAIPDVDPRLITYVIMFVLWSFVVAVIAARIFGKHAGETVAGNAPNAGTGTEQSASPNEQNSQ
jgi:BASS family bile acid:Na+ symporter